MCAEARTNLGTVRRAVVDVAVIVVQRQEIDGDIRRDRRAFFPGEDLLGEISFQRSIRSLLKHIGG